MFWYHRIMILHKVSEAGVKLLKSWKELHLSNKHKYYIQRNKQKKNLYQEKVYSLKLNAT